MESTTTPGGPQPKKVSTAQSIAERIAIQDIGVLAAKLEKFYGVTPAVVYNPEANLTAILSKLECVAKKLIEYCADEKSARVIEVLLADDPYSDNYPGLLSLPDLNLEDLDTFENRVNRVVGLIERARLFFPTFSKLMIAAAYLRRHEPDNLEPLVSRLELLMQEASAAGIRVEYNDTHSSIGVGGVYMLITQNTIKDNYYDRDLPFNELQKRIHKVIQKLKDKGMTGNGKSLYELEKSLGLTNS